MASLALRISLRLVALAVLLDLILAVIPSLQEVGSQFYIVTVVLPPDQRGIELDPRLLIVALASLILMLSLALALLAVVLLSPLLYALSVTLVLIANNTILTTMAIEAQVGVEPSVSTIAPLFVLSFLGLLDRLWRPGILESVRIRGWPSLVVGLVLLGVVAVTLSIGASSLAWRVKEAFENAIFAVREPTLWHLVMFIATNPICEIAVVGLTLVLLHAAVLRIAEIIVVYAKPSRELSLQVLTQLPLDTQIVPPLVSLRSLFATLLLLPPIYLLADTLLLERLVRPHENPLVQMILSVAVTWLVFSITWLIVSRILAVQRGEEPSLLPILAGGVLIGFIYVGAYLAGYWRPDMGLIGFSRMDEALANLMSGYVLLLKILEALLKLLGAAP